MHRCTFAQELVAFALYFPKLRKRDGFPRVSRIFPQNNWHIYRASLAAWTFPQSSRHICPWLLVSWTVPPPPFAQMTSLGEPFTTPSWGPISAGTNVLTAPRTVAWPPRPHAAFAIARRCAWKSGKATTAVLGGTQRKGIGTQHLLLILSAVRLEVLQPALCPLSSAEGGAFRLGVAQPGAAQRLGQVLWPSGGWS